MQEEPVKGQELTAESPAGRELRICVSLRKRPAGRRPSGAEDRGHNVMSTGVTDSPAPCRRRMASLSGFPFRPTPLMARTRSPMWMAPVLQGRGGGGGGGGGVIRVHPEEAEPFLVRPEMAMGSKGSSVPEMVMPRGPLYRFSSTV
ncbi:hypothetical protein EYF80_047083 [Liparis tanakae]|uniref:Uncharacterized protein n=1 Tax=Liparis tanakae TaxID=230148 RepID=A0A4Z2FPL3_9TELE|nr:hypothetical protein EYF80_047083 [Liparis tanakae]